MGSKLIISPVEKLQKNVNDIVATFKSTPCIYVSLNKTHLSIEEILKKEGIKIEKIFFIDCVTQEKKAPDVLYILPTELDLLKMAIGTFIKTISGKKFLLLDALSTLLIYNSEEKVARFVKEITEFAATKDVEVIAFSPKTQGEELLNKIFNFFDNVKK